MGGNALIVCRPIRAVLDGYTHRPSLGKRERAMSKRAREQRCKKGRQPIQSFSLAMIFVATWVRAFNESKLRWACLDGTRDSTKSGNGPVCAEMVRE